MGEEGKVNVSDIRGLKMLTLFWIIRNGERFRLLFFDEISFRVLICFCEFNDYVEN